MSDPIFSPAPPAPVLSVSALNRMARELLERSFPLFWVTGEISNLTRAASGHWYFSLKDEHAQVRCVMFRNRSVALDWSPREGDHVEARALVTLYEARGDFQLNIEHLRRAGLGALFEAFERLKARLQQEGLFDADRKKTLPAIPRQIGVITSPDAAALRDVLSALRRRMPAIPMILYPTPVQGKGAAEQIARALRAASHRAECDVLILCRGGGSLEDLWPFNEEVVARAIAASSIPLVSGIGHETDFTIADFVADLRAPTPTAAAELVAPDRAALIRQTAQVGSALQRQITRLLAGYAQRLDLLAARLLHPGEKIQRRQEQLQQLQLRLGAAMAQRLARAGAQLAQAGQGLAHLDPRQVLQRGYSLVHNSEGQLIRAAAQLRASERVNITLSSGHAEAVISDTST